MTEPELRAYLDRWLGKAMVTSYSRSEYRGLVAAMFDPARRSPLAPDSLPVSVLELFRLCDGHTLGEITSEMLDAIRAAGVARKETVFWYMNLRRGGRTPQSPWIEKIMRNLHVVPPTP